MKSNVFLAAFGEQKPAYFPTLEKYYKVVYPGYAYQEFADAPGEFEHEFDAALKFDLFGIKMASVLFYDVELAPSDHYIAWAVMRNIPVIVISQYLKGIESYWSSSITSLIKPSQLEETIDSLEKKNTEIIEERKI